MVQIMGTGNLPCGFILKGCGLWTYIEGTAIYSVVEDVERCELHDKENDFAYSVIIQKTIHLCLIN